jgi:hypothetical protein
LHILQEVTSESGIELSGSASRRLLLLHGGASSHIEEAASSFRSTFVTAPSQMAQPTSLFQDITIQDTDTNNTNDGLPNVPQNVRLTADPLLLEIAQQAIKDRDGFN